MAAPDPSKVFGGGKSAPADDPMPDEEDMVEGPEGDEELPPDFERAATEAFPDMEGDTERLGALYRAIEACKGDGGGLALILGKGKGK